ncbi:hypothetical protein ACFL7M_14930 [Thermodesulfobacteriota bacterium]
MKESQRKKIEDKLRRMIELQSQAKKENQLKRQLPSGTRVIRRRKGSPDKHIM